MFMKVNGIELFYELYGEGEPLLLLHGNTQNHHSLKTLIRFFKKNYQVIAVDSRAHGRSEMGADPLTFKLMAQDMLALLDQLAMPQYRVIGYSDGGIIALEMGILAPERQIASVTIGANYDVSQVAFFSDALSRTGYLLASLFAPISSFFKRLKKQIALTIYHPHIKEAELRQITAPLLAIVGEYDIISVADTKQLVASVKNGEMMMIKRATHFIPRQKPIQLIRLISRFFNQTAAN